MGFYLELGGHEYCRNVIKNENKNTYVPEKLQNILFDTNFLNSIQCTILITLNKYHYLNKLPFFRFFKLSHFKVCIPKICNKLKS